MSHVVVDEIHERGINEDLLLIILKDLLPRRRDLKLVLMSATLNAEAFQGYFPGSAAVHIPGFTFPVDVRYLGDALEESGVPFPATDLLVRYMYACVPLCSLQAARASTGMMDGCVVRVQKQGSQGSGGGSGRGRGGGRGRGRGAPRSEEERPSALQAASPDAPPRLGDAARDAWGRWWTHMQAASSDVSGRDMVEPAFVASFVAWLHGAETDSGAILVFLSGLDDVRNVHEALAAKLSPKEALVLPLHGSMATSNQREIFERPPRGMRKIVLATNIAETSITIDDVRGADRGRAVPWRCCMCLAVMIQGVRLGCLGVRRFDMPAQ